MSARLLDVLETIKGIEGVYPFQADKTFMELDRDELSRLPRVALHTVDENDYDILITHLVRRGE